MSFVRPLKLFCALTLIFGILHIHFDVITCNEGSSNPLSKRKGTLKTYKNEFGDIFDCVNLYQQPAFDHPLLINYTIQTVSHEWLSKNIKCPQKHSNIQNQRNLTQRCPKGTIPIKRSIKDEIQFEVNTLSGNPKHPEYASVKTRGIDHNLFGVMAQLNVSNPTVYYIGEYSLASISVSSGHGTPYYTSIEAGWIVLKNKNEKLKSTPMNFFIRLTTEHHGTKLECFKLECAGFFQTNNEIEIGGTLEEGTIMDIAIYQDRVTRDWWLLKDCELLGYWPSFVVPALQYGAEQIVFGGEIENKLGEFKRYSRTQMGNGRFGTQGKGKAAEIKYLQSIKNYGGLFDKINNYEIVMTNPNRYNATVSEFDHTIGGVTLYYGGPGYNWSYYLKRKNNIK